ncbi:LigB domain-containing protein [Mycena venus]|uniref:LigB domain-containing protein n=1 Tax=Mycena venus TaxID=2733690 RepID=A0A8H6XSN8_9AGAR|nr:LigB domain-containing protein [Mycena venus]
MCGRYSLRVDPAEIQQLEGYDASVTDWERRDAFVPRYNIAPHTQAPVVRRRNPGPGDSELVISSMKWGLVPHYSKFEDKNLNTTNARAENLVEGGGMWAGLKGPKRCAVVCQGYYEWLTKGKTKLPHFVKPKNGKLMLMAGLWDAVVLQGETETLWTFTIVTTTANSSFSWLHERQPVILHTDEALNAWLDTSSQKWSEDLVPLLAPTTCALECYQVPKEVGKVGTESSTFIEPVANRKDGIQAMFNKQKQAQAATPKKAPAKRRLSPAEDDDEVQVVDGPSSSKKKKPAPPSDDDEIQIVDGPSTPKRAKPTPKKKTDTPQASSSKITSFFNKP